MNRFRLLIGICCFLPTSVFGGEKPALPKVVILGDSIRLSYTQAVTTELKEQATVISPKQNGGDSSNELKNLEAWAIKQQPAVVHFNAGIHDTKKFLKTGKFQVSPEQYEANLRKIVERLRKETKATVIFATTTPILDDRAAKIRKGRDYELLNASVEQYNTIARKVMQELKVPVNDLYLLLMKPEKPHTVENLVGGDGVHLTGAGIKLCGKAVAAAIQKELTSE